MRKIILFLIVIIPFSQKTFSQTTAFEKECRISTGMAVTGVTENLQTVGPGTWLQLDYKILKTISVATEFENSSYYIPGYYTNLPVTPNRIKVVNNNFSLLLKYHFPTKSKWQVAVASGWTYSVRANGYYIVETDNNGAITNWYQNASAFSDYRIPLLAELEYPFFKKNKYSGKV